MKAIIFLLDSLNRHFLPCYENISVKTPNIDRLAARSCIFDNHYVGSAPCMPARHDILTGRLEFLERPWGPVQPYDCTVTKILKRHGVFTHMETDHYHYFHLGGEGYLADFGSWDFVRGQEKDCYVSSFGKMEQRPHYGQDNQQYRCNRTKFKTEADYPSPMTLQRAAEWIEKYHDKDNWLLYVDSFDPHEPFDYPEEDAAEYPDEYDDCLYYWPSYATADQAPEEAIKHLRRRYATLVTMSDRWIGKALDVMDKYDLWQDTMVILTTDHGLMLGEHGFMAKNYMPYYNEIYHIPMMISLPGMSSTSRTRALTQNIDLFPTILDYFKISLNECAYPLHGKSLLPLISHEAESIRESVIFGMFGKQVGIFDGRYTYFRSSVRADNYPLNIYTSIPITLWQYWDAEHLTDATKIEAGPFLPYTNYPVFKIPAEITKAGDDAHNLSKRQQYIGESMLFDVAEDPRQENPLHNNALEREMCKKLTETLRNHDCPAEQYVRLGLTFD